MAAAVHPVDMAGPVAAETPAGIAVVGAEAPGTSAVEPLQNTAVAPLVDMMDTLVAAEVA